MVVINQPTGHHEAITAYVADLNVQFKSPKPTEHSYRPAFANLLKSLLSHLNPSNEQGRTECGAPDYVLLRLKDNIPIGYIEAKDIGNTDLEGRNKNKEQFDRYKAALDNIIFTDYLDFHFCKEGQIIENVAIAEIKNNKIVPLPGNYDKFHRLLTVFGDASPQRITSSDKLAQIMANKARLMATVFEEAISRENGDSILTGQMEAFKSFLIHDITNSEFADLYAQTITYGMFAARMHTSTDTFNRKGAAKLIPKTNPFLRNLFHTIAGLDLKESISWIVDDLAEAFRVADTKSVLEGIGKTTKQTDPLIHFYEDFLSAYDPELRKRRGVWYTQKSVVQFIVRAVDEILQNDFDLPKGLADNSKIRIKTDKHTGFETHKVQILDPATGTGTFLAETISQIYENYKWQSGVWQSYVEQHLIPRLNGFEILMAPYAMAHLKLDWLLAETGYQHKTNQRLRIFLTNSLEEHHPDTGTLFAQFLANEAKEANSVKKNVPVMVIIGNPPYSGESWNKGEWIAGKMQDYKKEPGTTTSLNERNR
ncbi:MAG: N-6 DNA methylase, partial [Holophagales bacterium]|nr:N-6 DNA methylase [Holophagales bacterium]